MEDRRLAKLRAASAGLEYIQDGMRIGLGSGSTAELLIPLIAARGLHVIAVPTSRRTARLASAAGIPLTDFSTGTKLDLAIDGADEVTDTRDLLKGHGGALLFEKIVAAAAKQFVVVVDTAKRVKHLGRKALPIEVIPLAAPRVAEALQAMGGPATLRVTPSGRPYRTQSGHQMLDAHFGAIADPGMLAAALDAMPGVVEHGLFLGLAHQVLVAGDQTVTCL